MTLALFDETPATAPSGFDAELLAHGLVHPFPRYGLASALAFYSGGKALSDLSEAELREMLARAIEGGLNAFRMETQSNPHNDETLKFSNIGLSRLQADAELVQKAGLSAQGKYIFPSVITTDGGAKGTFEEASKIVKNLRDPKVPLAKNQEMKRSFAPMMGEVNNGGREKTNGTGTVFEAACSAAATVIGEKPAAWSDMSNTGIFPDLDIAHLVEFVKVFRKLQAAGTSLMEGKPSKPKSKNDKPQMRRPPLHDGNYPDAPREAAFGAVGLLASMGYWSLRADETTRQETLAVLDSLSSRSLYLVSYDGVQQAQFSHYVIALAKAGKLRGILNDFYRDTRPYALSDANYLDHSSPTVRHLFFAFGRFLQRFDGPSFRDFLQTRAEYPPSADLLLGVYFVESLKVSRPIVESARALGQWINRTAYFVAEEDTDKNAAERNKAVRKAKAKVLVEFESAVMSAENAPDMLHRVSTRAGRLLQGDAPAAATDFFDAVASEEVPFKTAQHLLIAYLRLRAVKVPDPIAPSGDTEEFDPANVAEQSTEEPTN